MNKNVENLHRTKTCKKTFSKINIVEKFNNKTPGISCIEMLLW